VPAETEVRRGPGEQDAWVKKAQKRAFLESDPGCGGSDYKTVTPRARECWMAFFTETCWKLGGLREDSRACKKIFDRRGGRDFEGRQGGNWSGNLVPP